ncbi:MAG: Gfo/Idh/MocA family oxidoreductase [Lentisphaeria bacterium]|nr:Gfo/Idh/MocA family oxidoreductase [Lentisphaeria bacterium]
MKSIVIIGASGHWPYAIRGLGAYADARLVGIAPGLAEETDQVKTTFKDQLSAGVPFFADHTTMLDQIRPDVAVINPYFYLNGPITIQCLERGIHCYTEKPLTFYREELDTIKALISEKGLRLSTMLAYRYRPAFQAVVQAVKEGRIGAPIQIAAQKSYKSGPKPEWQHRRSQFGGLIGWVGSHALDWINWVTDNGVGEVMALETTRDNHGNGEMESSAIVMMRLDNGGQAAANIDYLRPRGADSHGDDRLRIAGGKGVVEVLNGQAKLLTHDHGEEELPLEEPLEMFAEFLKTIGAPSHPYRQTHEDVFALTELCIRAQEAADAAGASQRGRFHFPLPAN